MTPTAHPVMATEKLYACDLDLLFCYDVNPSDGGGTASGGALSGKKFAGSAWSFRMSR
jgi:hypothetical protein